MLRDGECSVRALVWVSTRIRFPENWRVITNEMFALAPSMWTTLQNKSASIKYAGFLIYNH
jgi:hypothetical protein